MPRSISLLELRRYAVIRSLFKPTTLGRAISKLGFVQADPIRAPARAQDLTLRHRVIGYHAGDLERRYPKLAVEEDVFVNYGFLPSAHHALMHPRVPGSWNAVTRKRANALLAYVREHGAVHPRQVDEHFDHGSVRNYWGGSSNATSQLLEAMHYHSLLRVVRRDDGIRIYAERSQQPLAEEVLSRDLIDRLVDIVVMKYAPLPAATLSGLVYRLRYAAPHLSAERKGALARAKARLANARIDGIEWCWPGDEPVRAKPDARYDEARFLCPFDPVVWDRRRFELFWGWAYRFEAYTPAPRRKLGYYALPLLWRDEVIGWGNLALRDRRLDAEIGFVDGRTPAPELRAALRRELERMGDFLRAAGVGRLVVGQRKSEVGSRK
ncbi:MAG: crosslink repair DNA glycosylase YcaQ family protein [Gemmatimonadota bacterium]